MVNTDWKTVIGDGVRNWEISETTMTSAPEQFDILASDRIPFIACFTGINYFKMDAGKTQFGRSVTVEVLMRIFMSGCNIVKVKVRGACYLVGKGVLLNMELKVLAMLTVTQAFYNRFALERVLQPGDVKEHFTLLLNSEIATQPAYSGIYSKFRKMFSMVDYNVVMSWKPEEGVFAEKRFPSFPTLDQRLEFTRRLATEVVEKVLIQQVT